MLKETAIATLWARGDLSYKLWAQQYRIYNTISELPRDTQVVVVLCARQFGKSVLGCILALQDCLKNADVVVLIIAPTIKQARAIVRPRMRMLLKDVPEGLIRHVKSEDTWYFSNGSELKLGGFETGSSGQRGKTLHKIYMEETCDSDGDTYDDFMRSDLGPALTHSKHAQIIHLTTLPKIPDHPFVLETVPEAALKGAFFRFTIHDNEKLSQEQYDQCVKLCGGEHTFSFKREYLCEQVRDSRIILAPEFAESIHVREFDIPNYTYWWVGGDTGGIRDFSVFHLCAYDFLRAKILFVDERWYLPEIGSDLMALEIKEMEQKWITGTSKHFVRYIDAPGQLQVDFAIQHKLACVLPRKDELEATVNQVRVALQTAAVEIHPRCKLLITTLRSGTFNKHRTDLARTTTMGHMDAFMSAAYAIRHANKANPYPALGNAKSHTHYIRPTETNKTARDIRKAFSSQWGY